MGSNLEIIDVGEVHSRRPRLLVTGGSGMIGRQLVKLLQKESANVCVADLNEPINMSGITFKKVDLTNYISCLEACQGMDYVFNLVGIKCSPKVIQERPADIMTPMLQFNTNMMSAAMESNVKWYLYTSTVGVYGEAEIVAIRDTEQESKETECLKELEHMATR